MHRRYLKLVLPVVISAALLSCSDKPNQVNQITVKSENTQNPPTTLIFNLPRTSENFPAYVEVLKQFALANGISQQTVDIGFADIYHLERVITADRNQPEKKVTLAQYLSRAASDSRLKLAMEKMAEYHQQVNHAQKLTGVPAHYIIALWGVESGYGRYQGKEDVISAVATLAFEGRREAFFSRELIAALQILEKGYITKNKFKGSWAGAMGQCQFMPSSLLNYGKDGDGDGIIDIWNDTNDVLASIGNYLATVGWQADGYWGNQVTIPTNFNLSLTGLDNEKAKSISEWEKLGITITDHKSKPTANELAWLILPDENSAEGYLVYANFKTIMHWNRSYFFAISVGTIADSLTEK